MFVDLAGLAHHLLPPPTFPAQPWWGAVLPPDPAPVAPPGAEKITQVLGYIKWAAGLALLAGFFGGLVVYAAGRLVDHHRYGRTGSTMMIASVFGGLLYGIGYRIITSFAGAS